MRQAAAMLAALLLLCALPKRAYAEELAERAAEEAGAYSLEEQLTDEEKEISGKLSFDGSYDAGGAIARVWKSFLNNIVSELRDNLCALGGSLCSSKGISEYIEIAGCCGAAMIMLKGVDGIVSQTVESMFRLSDYSKAALPVIFTAAAAGGALTSAGAKFAAAGLALDVLMSIAQTLVVPLVYAYLAVTVANGVFPNSLMAAAARFTKWAATIIMTGMTISFTAYISMTGVITSSTDAAAVKTMRTVISTVLPVVGGMISDASGAVLAAAGVIRSCAGAFGLITVCILCAGPFAVLSVKMLILKAAAAVTDSMQSPRLSALFSGVGSAMGLLLGLLGCCGIMLFISMMAGMKAVTG